MRSTGYYAITERDIEITMASIRWGGRSKAVGKTKGGYKSAGTSMLS